jgi:hypothetical protein
MRFVWGDETGQINVREEALDNNHGLLRRDGNDVGFSADFEECDLDASFPDYSVVGISMVCSLVHSICPRCCETSVYELLLLIIKYVLILDYCLEGNLGGGWIDWKTRRAGTAWLKNVFNVGGTLVVGGMSEL